MRILPRCAISDHCLWVYNRGGDAVFKVILGAIVGIAGVVAWQTLSASIGDLTAAEARAVAASLAEGHGGLKAELREPVLKKPDDRGWLVCGWVRIGGVDAPLGHQPFVGLMSDQGAFTLASLAVTRAEVVAVRDVCALRRMML